MKLPTPLPCGCDIEMQDGKPLTSKILFCPTHKAAPEMVRILKESRRYDHSHTTRCQYVNQPSGYCTCLLPMYREQIEALLKAAEGNSVKVNKIK